MGSALDDAGLADEAVAAMDRLAAVVEAIAFGDRCAPRTTLRTLVILGRLIGMIRGLAAAALFVGLGLAKRCFVRDARRKMARPIRLQPRPDCGRPTRSRDVA